MCASRRWLVLASLAACTRQSDSPSQRAAAFARSGSPGVVAASPNVATELPLPSGETPIDLTVWPNGPEAALLVRDAAGKTRVIDWLAGDARTTLIAELPVGFDGHGIASHPSRRALFVSGAIGGKSPKEAS